MAKWFSFWEGQGRATYGEDLEVVGDRMVPSEISVDVSGGLSQPDLSMKIEVRQGIPICAELCLRSRPDGPEVREKDLAQVRVGWLVEQIIAIASMKMTGRPGEYGFGWSKPVNDKTALADIQRVRTGRSRMTPERLEKIAEIYRQHIDNRPTEAVLRAFDLGSHRTAARYVQQARNAGLLPTTTRGKKKA